MKKADRDKLKTFNDGGRIDEYIAVNKSGDSKQYFPQQLDKETPVVMNKGKFTGEYLANELEEESLQRMLVKE